MNIQQAEKFIRDLFTELWIPSDLSKAADYYHPGVRAHIGVSTLDYTGLCERIAYNKENLQDYKVEILDIISEPGKISARMKQQAYDAAKGVPLSFHVIAIYHLKDNKIHELWAELTGNLDLVSPK